MFKKIKQNLFRNSVRFRKVTDRLDKAQNSLYTLQSDVNFIKTLLLKKNESDLQTLFDVVYETNMWGYGSGIGSLEHVVAGYVEYLHEFFRTYKIKSVVDVGCGDWQFSKNINFSTETNGGGGGICFRF